MSIDLEWPMTYIPRLRHYLTLNISDTELQWNTRRNCDLHVPYSQVLFRMTSSALAKYSMMWSIAWPLCDSWDSCFSETDYSPLRLRLHPLSENILRKCFPPQFSVPHNCLMQGLSSSVNKSHCWCTLCLKKKEATWWLIITLANVDQYSKFFHQLICKKILLCIHARTATLPAICCYTTVSKSKIQKCYRIFTLKVVDLYSASSWNHL